MPEKKKLKVLFAAAEATPLVKVGGLADVVGSLPGALHREGVEVKTVIPCHGSINPADLEEHLPGKTLDVMAMNKHVAAKLFRYIKNGDNTPVYLLEGGGYFPRPQVYGYEDDLDRYLFFSRAVPLVADLLSWKPDVIHIHDWHTASVPLWSKNYGRNYRHVFTIHNLAYQGLFDNRFIRASELGKVEEVDWTKVAESRMNMVSQGLLYSDEINTVSPNYAKEILTRQFGEGLESLLSLRKEHLSGILNGIDTDDYNPAKNPYLSCKYDRDSIVDRARNKRYLQKKVGLPVRRRTPLIGMVTRLDEQKGMDILERTMEQIFLRFDIQLVVLGKGREKYEKMLADLAGKYPKKLFLSIDFSNSLAHQIYGGSDIFLMPSLFEPCGLGQLIAMRYGAIPLVSQVGGLVDTVFERSPKWETGRGFTFQASETESFLSALERAIEAYRDEKRWSNLIQNVMDVDFSWKTSARKYVDLYKMALKSK